MEVECAETGHSPNHFWKHSESNDDKQVGIYFFQLADKRLVFQSLRLENAQSLLKGVFLYVRLNHVVASAGLLVGHSDNGSHVVAAFYKLVQTCYCKFGSAEKNYF